MNGPRDVVIDPTNSFAFVSDFNNARILKVNLSNNTATTLLSGFRTDGLTFDAAVSKEIIPVVFGRKGAKVSLPELEIVEIEGASSANITIPAGLAEGVR